MYTRAQYQQELAAAQAEYNKTKDTAKYEAALSAISNKIQNEVANNPKGTELSPNDFAQVLNMSPGLLAKKQAELKAAQQQGIANQSLDLLNQGVQMAMSLGQVSRAKQAAAQLQRPEIPSVPASNPQLAQALNQAQLGTINVGDVLRPAQAQIQDAYRSALNQAQVASGGQAGVYQGMANLANLQRMRASLGLAPIAQEAKLQNQQVYNQLLGQRQEEIANQMRARLAGTEMALNQYDKDAQAIGDLGSMGRTNALLAGQQLTQSLQGLTPYLFQGQQPRPVQYSTQPVPDSNVYGVNVRPMLRSTLPNSPFSNQQENDFYNQVRFENLMRRQGADTRMIEEYNPRYRTV